MAGSEAAWQQAEIRLRGRVAAGCDAAVAVMTRAAAAREPSLMAAGGILTANSGVHGCFRSGSSVSLHAC